MLAPSFDPKAYLANFEDMEDFAMETITNLIGALPRLQNELENAVKNKNPMELERAAHTIKGVVSNFYAEPAKSLAYKLEKMGETKNIDGSEQILQEFVIELKRLTDDLLLFQKERKN